MNFLKSLFYIAISSSLLLACGGTDFKKTKSGAPYKIFGDGKGTKIVEGNIVKFHLTQKVKDSLVSTTHGQFPKFERISAASNEYDVRNIIMDALLNARKGDSIYIVMSMDTFIKRDPTIVQNTPFRKGDQIISTIKVLEVYRTPEEAEKDIERENMAVFNKDPKLQQQKAQDEKILQDYMNSKGIKAEKTPWGVYVQMLTPGQGPKPKTGQYAHLRYTGMDLNGKIFDSNNKPNAPLLPLHVGAGGAIMGFEDAVRQLPKGAKARVFIPSVLGYGEMGSPPVIQPNQNLIFELEVVDITDTPPQQQMPNAPQDTTRR